MGSATDAEPEKHSLEKQPAMSPTPQPPPADQDAADTKAASGNATTDASFVEKHDGTGTPGAKAAENGAAKTGGSSSSSGADADADVEYPKGPKLILIIAALCLSVFLVALDQTIIAPALGAITSEFGSVKDIGWYGAAYLLTSTATSLTYGRIYRIFSVKITF
ncbi:hypothetical protein MAPG_05466, partial [Magnaporthiopsis poae ATCC 64411]